MRRTKEQRIADMEAEAAQLKRKLRMETVPGVKEAVFLAKALRKWEGEYGNSLNPHDTNYTMACAATILEQCAEEPS